MFSCPNAPKKPKLQKTYRLDQIPSLDLERKLKKEPIEEEPAVAIKSEPIEKEEEAAVSIKEEPMENDEDYESDSTDESDVDDSVETEAAIANGDRPDLNFFDWEKIVNPFRIRKRFTKMTPDDILKITDRSILLFIKDFVRAQSVPMTLDEHLYVAFLHSACVYRLAKLNKRNK